MKKTITLIFIISGYFSFAQQTQISFHFNSGLFSFGGSSPEKTSFINVNDFNGTTNCYTNSPYGTMSGFSYGLGVQFQKLTRKNFIYALQLGYESLSSKILIDQASGDMTWNVENGRTILTNNFINLFPSIGQRFRLFNQLDTDLLGGFDLGLGLSSTEHIRVTTDQGEEFSATNERDVPKVDFRPRIELINYYKSFGLSIGYSFGLTNYQANLTGGNRESMARYLRLGLSYRLK